MVQTLCKMGSGNMNSNLHKADWFLNWLSDNSEVQLPYSESTKWISPSNFSEEMGYHLYWNPALQGSAVPLQS